MALTWTSPTLNTKVPKQSKVMSQVSRFRQTSAFGKNVINLNDMLKGDSQHYDKHENVKKLI